MNMYKYVLIFLLLSSNVSPAQISQTEFEWQLLSWIREIRLGLLIDIEMHEYNQTTDEFYKSACACKIDGISMRKNLDTLIANSQYAFVQYIYAEMREAVPNENILYYDLAPLWNNKLKGLENLFVDVQSHTEQDQVYISKKKLQKISLGRLGNEFRSKILNLYSSDNNSYQKTTNRFFSLIKQHIYQNTEQENYCCSSKTFSWGAYRAIDPSKSKNNHPVKNRYQFQSYLYSWLEHSQNLLGNYIDIVDDSRKKDLNTIKVDLPALKKDLRDYSKKSPFLFVQEIYTCLHKAIPDKESYGKVELIELWVKTLIDISNNSLDSIKTNKSKLISCKELKKIKHIRNLYDFLDIEPYDKANEDHQIKSVLTRLIEKNLLKK